VKVKEVPVSVTVKLASAVLPAVSHAVTVSRFVPSWSAIPGTLQTVFPLAVPLPPRLFTQVTRVIPTALAATPPNVTSGSAVL
jgi:hypothetical protein